MAAPPARLPFFSCPPSAGQKGRRPPAAARRGGARGEREEHAASEIELLGWRCRGKGWHWQGKRCRPAKRRRRWRQWALQAWWHLEAVALVGLAAQNVWEKAEGDDLRGRRDVCSGAVCQSLTISRGALSIARQPPLAGGGPVADGDAATRAATIGVARLAAPATQHDGRRQGPARARDDLASHAAEPRRGGRGGRRRRRRARRGEHGRAPADELGVDAAAQLE